VSEDHWQFERDPLILDSEIGVTNAHACDFDQQFVGA
jgi:hypothetical protein